MTEFRGIVTGCHIFRHNKREIVLDIDGEETGWQFVCPISGITTGDSLPPIVSDIINMVTTYHTTNAIVSGIDQKNTIGGYTSCTSITLSAFE